MNKLLLCRTSPSSRPVFLLGRSGVAGGVGLVGLADSGFGEIVEGAAAENEDCYEGKERELLPVAAARAGRSAVDGGLGAERGCLVELAGEGGTDAAVEGGKHGLGETC